MLTIEGELDLERKGCIYFSVRKRFIGKIYALFHLLMKTHRKNKPYKSFKDICFFLTNNRLYDEYIYKDFQLIRLNGSAFNYEQIYQHKQYEIQISSKKPVIVDLGCNIGLSIIYFKKAFPKSVIYGFEPNKLIAPILAENITHNIKDLKNTHLYLKAVQKDKQSEGLLITPNNDHSQSFVVNKTKTVERLSDVKKLKIETISFREIISGLKVIDLLKIDIEKGEYELFPEIIKFHKSIKNFIVEIHGITNLDTLKIMKKLEHYFNVVVTPAFTGNMMLSGMINEFLRQKEQTYILYAKHI
jgi:FkbM family methyltransferase